MPALNFQERFAEAVTSGEKRQTIRRVRKRPIKVGDELFFYTGQHNQCRYLTRRLCRRVSPIQITDAGIYIVRNALEAYPSVAGAGGIAQKDGFRDWPEMREWFRARYGLPFHGVLIEW
jgi:hypothetical protein